MKRLLSLGIICAVCIGMVFGGGGQQNSSAGGAGQNTSGPDRSPVKITMLDLFDGNEPPANNDVYKKIADFSKVDLEIFWAPGGGYMDKVNTNLASGSLPTLMLITDNKAPTVIGAINGGAFWDLTSYLPEFKQLNNVNKDIYYNLSLDGKTYFLPRNRPVVKDGIIYRKDWLDKLGLKEPKNLDELYDVLKAFTENDPDGNGRKDTYGVADAGLGRFRYMVSAVGGINEYAFIDGKMIVDHFHPSYLRVLQFYRKLYVNGYMNKDFPLLQLAGIWEKINKNEAGMIFSDPEQITYFEELKKIVPAASFGSLTALDAGKSKLSTGHNGGFAIAKSAAKTEKDLRRVLQFMEDLCSDEIQNLFVWGTEGTHYTMEGGKAKRSSEQITRYQNEVYRWERALRIRDIDDSIPGILSPEQTIYQVLVKESTSKMIPNPAITLISPTWTTEGPKLNKIINDARVKYIMGEIDDAGWQAAVNSWRTGGGDKVLEEMTALYLAQNK